MTNPAATLLPGVLFMEQPGRHLHQYGADGRATISRTAARRAQK